MPLLKGQLIEAEDFPGSSAPREGAGQSHDHHAGGIFRTRRLSGAFGSPTHLTRSCARILSSKLRASSTQSECSRRRTEMKFRRVARRVPRKRAVWSQHPLWVCCLLRVVGNQDLLVPRTGKLELHGPHPKARGFARDRRRSSGNRRPSAQPAAAVSGASTWLGPMKQLCLFSPPRACPRSPGSGRAHARPRAASQTQA